MNQEAEGCGPGCRLGYHVTEQPRSQETALTPTEANDLAWQLRRAAEARDYAEADRIHSRLVVAAAKQPRSQEAAHETWWRGHDRKIMPWEWENIEAAIIAREQTEQPRSQEATLTLVARIVQDCIYGLRNQPDISREGIAEVLERDVLAALAPTPSGD